MEEQANNVPRGRGGKTLRVLDPDDIRTRNVDWTDTEFAIASNLTEGVSLMQKIEFIYKHTRWNGLFDVEERIIDGGVYRYGIDIGEDYATAQTVCQMLIEYETPRQVIDLIEKFNFRLNKCEEIEKHSFIDAEIAIIDKKVSGGEKRFCYGYDIQQRKERWVFPELVTHFHSGSNPPLDFIQLFIDTMIIIDGTTSHLFKIEILKIKEGNSQKPEEVSIRKEIPNPVVSLFCYYVNQSGADVRNEGESEERYCKRICKRFNLEFVDKVRQGFNNSKSKTNIAKMKNLIFINIDSSTTDKISEYISKQQPPPKLYA